ncbi:hypothetical protein NPA08_00260 [Mycoplasmopsis citelli]|uniref:hypothetical protein n=1 Tax=Mycoplasmopsis citelli TaxID=171281 RepID=UPI0021153516|nr:hypothetical protein [Mycoplasmopsis citelli]UUD36261.1 hypothetical protein NPA08_00260 [Mycoplasmopsis citelli]
MFKITPEIKETFEYLENQFDYNTDEFLNKINLHIQTLSDKKRENYIYDLKQIFDSSYLNESLNSKKEDKAKNLFLATQILNLNPSYKILKEISKTLDYAFEYNEEYEYISNYLIDNDIYTGATWNQNLHEDLQENGVNISYISLIEKIRELEFDQYYQKMVRSLIDYPKKNLLIEFYKQFYKLNNP